MKEVKIRIVFKKRLFLGNVQSSCKTCFQCLGRSFLTVKVGDHEAIMFGN